MEYRLETVERSEDGIPESQVFQPKTINMGLLLSIWVVVV